jgi:hypothetical protein
MVLNKEEMKMKKYEYIFDMILTTLDRIEWSVKNAPYAAKLLQDQRVEYLNCDLSELYSLGIY